MMRSFFSVFLGVLLLSAAGWEIDSFGPDTPTGWFYIAGVVSSAEDGAPIEGARVFLDQQGLLVYSGRRLDGDTDITNLQGQFHLEAKFYCPAKVRVEAEGFDSGQQTAQCGSKSISRTMNFILSPEAH